MAATRKSTAHRWHAIGGFNRRPIILAREVDLRHACLWTHFPTLARTVLRLLNQPKRRNGAPRKA